MGIGRGLVIWGQGRVHIKCVKTGSFCTGDVRFPVVGDHKAMLGIQLLLLQERAEKSHIRFAETEAGGDIDPVKGIREAQMAQFIPGEHLLGIT